jgi:hypothetical protein
MKKSKHTFYEISEKGIIMLSLLSTDIPFIIQCNPSFGIVMRLSGDTIDLNSDIDWQLLNLDRMVLYNGDFEDHSRWILAIPTLGCELDPLTCFEISHLGIHYKFSEKDFPKDFQSYKNLSVIAGFPE